VIVTDSGETAGSDGAVRGDHCNDNGHDGLRGVALVLTCYAVNDGRESVRFRAEINRYYAKCPAVAATAGRFDFKLYNPR
jgi:hypothetical protein